VVEIFGREGGRAMSQEMGVPFLGSIPIEPEVVTAGDGGTPVVKARPESMAAQAFGRVVGELLASNRNAAEAAAAVPSAGQGIRIAVPIANGVLASHFGHCEQFVLFDVGADHKSIENRHVLPAPPHEPGTYPKWLHEQGATVIIAGGMGSRAQDLCGENGIRVVVGASSVDPELLVQDFLADRLVTGPSQCDH
jgi:predicted Fe-Mo cluster-binding NifX family protein